MKIPKYYQNLKTLPDDPPMCKVYGVASHLFQSIIKLFPIPRKYLMPLDTDEIINGIHNCLANDQGLIECEMGKTKSGKEYIYSIIFSF